MSDLISREEILKRTVNKNSIWLHITNSEGKNLKEIVEEIPSADIMEYARAIKEYCEKYDEHCVGCPFNSAKPTLWCALGGSSLPHEWDLPEGEKEGE